MKVYKKGTISLVLASLLTVSAYGSDSYKNSLTGLILNSSANGQVSMEVLTKTAYEGDMTPRRKDANTYILILPEVKNEAISPDFSGVTSDIASVNIGTMPYSNGAKGYTRITVKTKNSSLQLSAHNNVSANFEKNSKSYHESNKGALLHRKNIKNFEPDSVIQQRKSQVNKPKSQVNNQKPTEPLPGLIALEEKPTTAKVVSGINESTPVVVAEPEPIQSSNNTYLWLWALLIVLGSAFFYIRAKGKIHEIVGETFNINLDNPATVDNKKSKKVSHIRTTIQKLDATYTNPAVPGKVDVSIPTGSIQTVESSEELDIVDLDKIFQEHQSKKQISESDDSLDSDENQAFEDFLSGFSFDDEQENTQVEQEDTPSFNEQAYQQVIGNENIQFSKDDIDCINKLLTTEILDETRRNIHQYAVSSPVVKKLSQDEIIEKLVANYAISQDIKFTRQDIDTLYKLMSVELDNDFITNLRTNPQRTLQMEQDILAYGDKPKKPSEIITLSVKDMLPNLSEALKQQGNRAIESQHRAETIYYSEGYEVSKLSLKDSLPDLSLELKKKDAYKSKPSAEYQYVDNTYNVGSGELKIASELPNLQDALAHPEKYEETPSQKSVVDEEALLKNIANVQFKPFDDGTNQFEIINDINDVPSVKDIQEEFKQFDGFEIAEEEKIENAAMNNDYDDFQSLYSTEYVDLDKQGVLDNKASQNQEESTQLQNTCNIETKKLNNSDDKQEKVEVIRCILDGEVYTVVSNAPLSDNKGCYLAQNTSGYAVLGYIGDKLLKIKQFTDLKTNKIYARISETLADGTSRYIIRIGTTKFMISVNNDSIKYLMDL